MHSRSDADHVVRAFVPWAPPRVRRRVTHRLAGPCRFQGILREKRALKQQIAALEGENVRLKSSVYELSWRWVAADPTPRPQRGGGRMRAVSRADRVFIPRSNPF